MPPLSKRLCTVIPLIMSLAGMTACTTVFETSSLNQVEGIACRSSAGAYYLPKVLVRLSIGPNAAGRGYQLNDKTPTFSTVADRRHQPYCLDYLASPTSIDVVSVKRHESGLLEEVTSNVEDRSAEIAIKLIETGEFLAKAGFRDRVLGAAGVTDTADFMFDPFDPQELTEINQALRRFGFCAYVENHSFQDGAISPQAWCSDPKQARYVNQYNMMLATTPVMPELINVGILYRPNATHKLVIRRKADPGGREPWALFTTKHMEMPNVSPIFSIGVYRALFATRTTNLTFAKGVLTNIYINKTSELESFSRIPLRVAQAIVRLPTEIIQLRIDDTTKGSELASKEAELITTLATLNQTTMNNPGAVATMGLPAADVPAKLKQMMDFCMQQGGSPDFCKNKVLGIAQ